jgi:hypothetical protein
MVYQVRNGRTASQFSPLEEKSVIGMGDGFRPWDFGRYWAKGRPGQEGKMAEDRGGILLVMAGFLLVGGGMITGLGMVLTREPTPLPWAEPEAEVAAVDSEEEQRARGERLYVPLTKFLDAGLGRGQPRMEASLTVAVRGTSKELIALNTLVGTNISQIEAAMMAEALEVMGATPDSASIHKELPGRLRDAINRTVGTEEWPAPVEEVLITSLSIYR